MQRPTPFGPSPYQEVVRDQLDAWGESLPDGHWLEKPAKGDPKALAVYDYAVELTANGHVKQSTYDAVLKDWPADRPLYFAGCSWRQ